MMGTGAEREVVMRTGPVDAELVGVRAPEIAGSRLAAARLATT
jgi:hypothetical protein